MFRSSAMFRGSLAQRAKGRSTAVGSFAAAALALGLVFGSPAVASGKESCIYSTDVVTNLSYGSRYSAGSVTKDVVDAARNEEVVNALASVDDFIRDLARHANKSGPTGASGRTSAACALQMLDAWADADGLSDLGTDNVKMTIGSRLAGIALAYSQVVGHASTDQQKRIENWLVKRVEEQVRFWDRDAPTNARRGNLKAWIALAAIAVGQQSRETSLVAWGRSETQTLLCSIDADGAIPREMERGSRALHYQLHALNALTTSVALLDEGRSSGMVDCRAALDRAIWFAVRDIEAKGALSSKKSGKAQNYFTSGDTLKSHHVAFGVSYLVMSRDPQFAEWIGKFGVLNNSKLGGNQGIVWSGRIRA